MYFPPVGAADAVGNGEVPSLFGLHVIFLVCVTGKNNRSLKVLNQSFHAGNNGDRFGGAEGTVDKVVLHIYNDQKLHEITSKADRHVQQEGIRHSIGDKAENGETGEQGHKTDH